MNDLLWAGVGGLFGALARWGLQTLLPAGPGLLWGTLLANALGSALICAQPVRHERHRQFWHVGVLGGFTSLSALVQEAHQADLPQGLTGILLSLGAVAAGAGLGLWWRRSP